MIEIVNIGLENEMDLIVASKRTTKIADFLNLSLSAQTTFTTAVSEICREIIEKIRAGNLVISLQKTPYVFHLIAQVIFQNTDKPLKDTEEGFMYARRLVSQFRMFEQENSSCIEIKISLPRTTKLLDADISELVNFFINPVNETPYEIVKRKNSQLNKLTEQQQEELARSNYLNEKKSEFLSIASHELKTPLTIIKAYSQLLLSVKGDKNINVHEFVSKIDVQVTKINLLIDRLLNFSKVESGRLDFIMEPTALNPFIKNVYDVYKIILSTHSLSLIQGPDVTVLIDPLKLEQVFSNLLGNAAKYSAQGSVISISTTVTENAVTVMISDQGIGMSKDATERIFQKFYREEEAARKYSGFGVGLFIAQQIIDGHKGTIWVESTLEKGSSFYFALPLLKG